MNHRRYSDPVVPKPLRVRVPRDRDFALKCNLGMDGFVRYNMGRNLPEHPHPDQLMGFAEARIDEDNRNGYVP